MQEHIKSFDSIFKYYIICQRTNEHLCWNTLLYLPWNLQRKIVWFESMWRLRLNEFADFFQSDIWALGCLLYEMVTLHKVFDGTNLPALVSKIMSGTFAPLPTSCSPDIRDLILSMLQKVVFLASIHWLFISNISHRTLPRGHLLNNCFNCQFWRKK